VPPYLISATVIGVLAQRLARTLCPACKQPDEHADRALLDAAIAPWKLKGQPKVYRAVGCIECRKTGFRGRVGFYELLAMSESARLHVHPVLDADALRRQALAAGMHPLRAAGVMKVAEGVTTLEEVLRTTPAWEGHGAG
jgi:general secretion pathway protein E